MPKCPAAYCHFEGRSSRRICGSDTLQALGPGTSAQTLMARNAADVHRHLGMGQNPGTPGEHQNSW